MVFTKKGIEYFFSYFTKEDTYPLNNLSARLFTNNYQPSINSVAQDFTEATGGGYNSIQIQDTLWSLYISHNKLYAVYPDISFIFSGILTGNAFIYGHYITDSDNNVLFAANVPYMFPFYPLIENDKYKFSLSIVLFGDK